MILDLVVKENYPYEVKITSSMRMGKLFFRAELYESATVSHFDMRKIHEGGSIEEAVSSIGRALEDAIDALNAC